MHFTVLISFNSLDQNRVKGVSPCTAFSHDLLYDSTHLSHQRTSILNKLQQFVRWSLATELHKGLTIARYVQGSFTEVQTTTTAGIIN